MELKLTQDPAPNAAPQPPPQDSEFELGAIVGAVLAYKWIVLLVVAAAIGGTYAWTARLPRLYQATCTLEYDPTPPQPLGRRFEDTGARQAFWANRELFETQDRIIASRGVAEKVVRKFGLESDVAFLGISEDEQADFSGVPVWQAAEMLRGRVQVDRIRDTRLANVSVTAEDPEQAQMLANAVADAYMEKSMEDRLGATASALEWLGTQLDSLKTRLESAEIALHEFSEEHTELSVPLEDQKRIVAADITQLSSSLTAAKERHIELGARLKSLVTADAGDALTVNSSLTANNSTVQQLRRTYGDLLTERGALSVEFGEAHPKLRAVDARIAGVQLQLRGQIDGLVASARADVEQVRTVETGLKQALSDANAAGLELNLQEITYRRLERERNNASQLYSTILERTAEADLANAMHVSYVRLVDRALVPRRPISPRVRFNLVLGGVLGLLLGLVLALALSSLDRTIQGIEDTEGLGATVLGVMPKMGPKMNSGPTYGRQAGKTITYAPERDMVVHEAPKSSAAECCRAIRTNLTFMGTGKSQSALAVTSANPREGKTTVALSIAITFAQSGKRVAVIDTDMRKPRIHRALGATNARGVTSVLVKAHSLEEAMQDTAVPGLSFLACGPVPPNPSELLHSKEFGALIEELRSKYDQLIFDSPPLAAVTDAAVLAPQVDGTVIVVSARQTSRDALASVLRQLRDVGARITGAVLNRVDLSERRYGYGSYYYYHNDSYYGTDASEDEQPAAEA